MKISVGDTVLFDGKLDSKVADITNVNLSAADINDYYQVMYKIPSDVVRNNVSDPVHLHPENYCPPGHPLSHRPQG